MSKPLIFLLCAILTAPAAAETIPTSYTLEFKTDNGGRFQAVSRVVTSDECTPRLAEAESLDISGTKITISSPLIAGPAISCPVWPPIERLTTVELGVLAPGAYEVRWWHGGMLLWNTLDTDAVMAEFAFSRNGFE